MKRLYLSVIAASVIAITGCGGSDDHKESSDNSQVTSYSHLVFNPTASEVPVPNALLRNGTFDGTLVMPGEASGDYTNPSIAIGALDGWSTTQPISIDVSLASDDGTPRTLLASSVYQPGAVRLFEAVVGGPLSSDSDCQALDNGSACSVGAELTWGVDFISMASGSSIAIVPLKPLKPNTSYVYATTSLIMDSAGQPVMPSESYSVYRQDVTTSPIGSASTLWIQTLINSYEHGMASAHGVDLDSVTYSGLFTTQAIGDVYEAVKLAMLSDEAYQPVWVQQPTATGMTVAQAAGLTAASGTAYVLADLADLYVGALRLPIYGSCSSAGCASGINGFWKAAGDSPVAVLQALQTGQLSMEGYTLQAQNHGIDPAAALANPALMAGYQWQLNNGAPVDSTRHLTHFNPLPAVQGYEVVPVMMSIPNATKLAAFNAMQGRSFTAPTNGWPTTIAMHGLGGGKEMALAYAGAYAAAGQAVVAIDMPLHGARSFDANADGVYEVSATDVSFGPVIGTPTAFTNGSPLVFVNIGSPLSVRDNFRQATADELALRQSLNLLAADTASPLLDASKVTAQGMSLGGIVGTDFATYASTGLVDPSSGNSLPNAFALQGVSLVVPAGGLAGAFAGSAAFSPVLFSNVTASETFQALVTQANTAGYAVGSAEYNALVQAVYQQFIPTFAFAIQTSIEAGDPINQAAKLAESGLPVQLIEVVGDGAGNLGDQTLPNSVSGFPLSGTEPLISALGLSCVDSMASGSGVVRFTKGHHSSIVSPSEVAGVTDGMAAQATAEMQAQVATFAASASAGAPMIVVTNPAVVQSCSN
ncbi:lipase [Shewanella avicenniae]|uniref:Lipase n=1 Tax=Shewanella avicenniae TaxID=2814294 RepID=A0ABX7QMR6_9GAMM|nr:VolA/Pla-1 family phospholipase [Shewanella avicenniae]QSX32290.1 lipase [Shewanella avicenniae]